MTFSCDHNIKKDEMTCDVSLSGEGTTTAVLPANEIEFLTATVTAGEELLDAEATGSSSSAAIGVALTAASSATLPARTGLTTQSTGTAYVTALPSGASGAEPAAQTTNAAYRYGVGGPVLLALAGAAAINMW
jgi:hypothetical protein